MLSKQQPNEWWESYAVERDDGQEVYFPEAVEQIVAEATRRAELKTWEEARNLRSFLYRTQGEDFYSAFTDRIEQYGTKE